jgi:hypothetical protein
MKYVIMSPYQNWEQNHNLMIADKFLKNVSKFGMRVPNQIAFMHSYLLPFSSESYIFPSLL